MTEPLLHVAGVTKRFGGLTALSDVDFDVYEGQITGLIGPNGAGKTTCFNLVAGTQKPTAGRILFRGESIEGLPPHRIVAKGIARTYQSTTIFPQVSVEENILRGAMLRHPIGFGAALFNTGAAQAALKAAKDEVANILAIMELEDYAPQIAGTLAYGHQKLVGVAIGLATQPQLLLLDEPAAGLHPDEVDRFSRTLVELRNLYTLSILIVEHHMRLIMSTCDRIVVLNYGQKLAEGEPADIRRDPKVIEAYLGAEHVG